MSRRPPRRYVVIAAVAMIALVGALIGPAVYAFVTDTSAKDRIAADPPPALLPISAASARIDPLIDPQGRRAARMLARYLADRAPGTADAPDDAGFTAWVEANFPAPPSASSRTAQMAGLERLAAARTPAGVTASTWLEAHGKKDVWKLAAHDQAELLDATGGDARKAIVDDALGLAKTIADDLGARFQVSAPYVVEPSLRTDHTVTAGQVCPCSYPSRHASAAAASRTVLGRLMPDRDGEYHWWQEEIDYSRLYMAGHYPTDIAAGTLLGDLIGDYLLLTRAGLPVGDVTGAAVAR